MSNNSQSILLDKLVLPVIILVLGFMGTWTFNVHARMAVVEEQYSKVEGLIADQRTADRMVALLEQQTKANTELVLEMKNSQAKLSDTVNELKVVLATCCSKPNSDYRYPASRGE